MSNELNYMTWDNILLAVSICGFTGGVVFFFWTALRKPVEVTGEAQIETPKDKVRLEELSKTWIPANKQQKEQIHLKDLCHLWRKVEDGIPESDDTVVHTFTNDRVRKFFHKYIHEKPYFKKAHMQRNVVIQLLHILDAEGNCPSVVTSVGDPESALSATTHGILRRVSLLNHTVNVAEIICQKIKKESPQGAMLMAPDALICALGHDLGKLPRFCADGYTHGSHPITSNTILQEVKDFKLLKNREMIENAIKRHHHANLDQEKNPLLRLLAASDIKARVVEQDVVIGLDKERFENQRYVYHALKDESPAPEPHSLEIISKYFQSPAPVHKEEPELEEAKTRKQAAEVAAAWKEQEFLSGISDPIPEILAEKAKETVWLDGWFRAQQFLSDLEKEVNKMEGMRIKAFSMPTGEIYVPRDTMIKLVQKQASYANIKWINELGVAVDLSVDQTKSNDQKIWTNLLVGIVDIFREQGFVDPSIITPGFYGNHFDVVSEPIPTAGTRFYTVFRADAFSTTIGQFETKKVGHRILNIKKVTLAPAKGGWEPKKRKSRYS